MKIIFFGSTDDSVLVLEKLRGHVHAVVTQPPRPIGRNQTITPTPVEVWAKEKNITTLSFPSHHEKPWLYKNENQVIDTLQPLKADLLVSACFGQKIPWNAISKARFRGLNIHPSLLPRWRGADPVPWAILSGDHQTGVSVVTLSKNFDEGHIIAQKKIPITDKDTSDVLRTKLFTIGAQLLEETLALYTSDVKAVPHIGGVKLRGKTYARRLTRDDGFEPWEALQKALVNSDEANRIDCKFRAFTPWPGIWTKIGEKRLKILALHIDQERIVLDEVQWEGKKPISYSSLLTASRNAVH